MTRRLIEPIDFANLVRSAQGLRMAPGGAGKIVAAQQACDDHGISRDWSVPLLGFLNDSPASAESWAERVSSEAFARMAARMRELDAAHKTTGMGDD